MERKRKRTRMQQERADVDDKLWAARGLILDAQEMIAMRGAKRQTRLTALAAFALQALVARRNRDEAAFLANLTSMDTVYAELQRELP